MGDEFERRADMEEALSGGTVGTSTYAAAEVLAENHPQIATALQNYNETKERNMTVGDQSEPLLHNKGGSCCSER